MPLSKSASKGSPSLWSLGRYFFRLGSTGFGGSLALAEKMRRELVETRAWTSLEAYGEGVALAQLVPGPFATPLAMYLGYSCLGMPGALCAGILFVLPSFFIITFLAIFYERWGANPSLAPFFMGCGAAVISVVLLSLRSMANSLLGRDPWLWVAAFLTAILSGPLKMDPLWPLLGIGLLSAATAWRPKPRLGAFALLALGSGAAASSHQSLLSLFLFFFKSGLVIFGSGMSILPFLHHGVVTEHAWLSERQFLDALSFGLAAPGPMVVTVAFMGYLVAAWPGATLAALGAYLPSFLMVLGAAPFYHRLAAHEGVRNFVKGVSAAAVGALGGASYLMMRPAWQGPLALGLGFASLALLLWRRGLPEYIPILGSGLLALGIDFAMRSV